MRGVIRFVLLVLMSGVLLCSTTSCDKRNRSKEKFQVVSVDGLSGAMDRGWCLSLTIANNTGANIVITDAKATLRYKGRSVGQFKLEGEVVLPRRKCSRVEVPLRATLSLNIFSILGKIRQGDFSDLTVDYTLSVRALSRNRTIEQSGVSLQLLAEQFNFGIKK